MIIVDSPYYRYRLALEKLELRYESQRKALREALRMSQRECPHTHTTYIPDASGNNDSETICNHCGASL